MNNNVKVSILNVKTTPMYLLACPIIGTPLDIYVETNLLTFKVVEILSFTVTHWEKSTPQNQSNI